MMRIIRLLAIATSALGLAAGAPLVLGQPKDKGKDRQEQADTKGKADKDKKAKKQTHQNGKQLVGDKIKKNGRHELHKHGKNTAYVDVQDGKIRGVSVKHSEKGDVPVTKYKTSEGEAAVRPVSLMLVQAQSLGTIYIGYSYIDEYGEEVIYWFPYEMIYDGDTGAVEYVPIY
jgi:flagellar hook assembly protein FlgD